ncbi:hypothetical protein ACFFLS_02850 [Flavobacterium procerum]|uniref:Lipoprotein n=1 Tax=Flavobacterium procerum TaxID=1455569 RepID=A0ABV6BKJ2_9FLAO
MKKIYIVLLIVWAFFTSCEDKTASLQFEKDVMYEVYPALIDTVWVNASRRYVPPPPPGIDPSEYKLNRIKESNERFNKELAEFKEKKFPVDLVFLDKAVRKDNSKELQKHFKDAAILENSADTLEYRFDRKKLDSYKAFHLRYVARIPKGNDRLYYNECCYSIRGILSFSRIQFDSDKKYGVLTTGVYCGAMCDFGYRIFIKKVNNKWVVDKIEEAWSA